MYATQPSAMLAAARKSPHDCALEGTVVGTVASRSYLIGLQNLAETARAVGFPCVVVQPFDWFEELRHELLVPLPVPSPTLLPRTMWCHAPYNNQYGWRRSQLYRARLWRSVLELQLDLLALDLDHQLGTINPMPFLRAVRAPPEIGSRRFRNTSHAARQHAPTDVIAVWDGPVARYLNVGIMWMRSTEATRLLTRRAENRTFGGWEQGVFNEEINYNADLLGVRCCHSMCLKRLVVESKVVSSLPKKDKKSTATRTKAEGASHCSDDQPYALYPPMGSIEHWVKTWRPLNETLRSKHTSSRKIGRCNNIGNRCILLDAGGDPHQASENCTLGNTFNESEVVDAETN